MHTTQGIILTKTNAGESDCVFNIYTKDFGKIRARAQGVKKEAAKLKGHLEPLNLVSVSFVLGKSGERLTHASLLNSWPEIRGNYEKISAALYISGLVNKHCLAGEKDEPLWGLLKSGLLSLEQEDFSQSDPGQFRRKFEAEFLAGLGYAGEKDIRVLGL